MVSKFICMRIIGDTMVTDMSKEAINEGLLDAKKTAYLLHIVPLLSEDWDLCFEVL